MSEFAILPMDQPFLWRQISKCFVVQKNLLRPSNLKGMKPIPTCAFPGDRMANLRKTDSKPIALNKPTNRRQQSLLEAIWSSLIWGSLDRLTSLIKHVFIASAIGLSAELDVFYMANALLTLFVNSWSRIADVIAVPRLVALTHEGHDDSARRLTGDLFTLSCVFSLSLGTLLTVFWPSICHLAWGFDASRMSLLEEAVHYAEPLILLTIPVSMLYSFAKARKAFYLRYRNDFLTSITILGCVTLYPESPGVLIWSFSLGTILSFLIAIAESRKSASFLGNPLSSEVKYLLPMAPLLLVFFGVEYLYALVNRQFVSFLPQGTVSAVAYAWTLAKLLPGLLRIDGAFMTFYAESQHRPKERADRVNSLISTGIAVGICLSFIIFEYSEPFIRLALERGKFNPENTRLVAHCTGYFGLSMIPFLLMPALGQICQVENRMKILMRRTLFGLMLNIGFGSLFLFKLNWGAEGVSIATSISQWGMLLASMALMGRLSIGVNYPRHIFWFLSTLIYGAAALSIARQLPQIAPGNWNALLESLSFLLFFALPILFGKGSDSAVARILMKRGLSRIGIIKV